MPILNLQIDQGATFKTDLSINQDETTPMDLTGFSFRSEIRKHYRSANVTENITVRIKTGVSTITLSDGGTGYTSAPTVVITEQGGDTPSPVAVATATIVSGVVTAITVTVPGSGYITTPLISFTGGGGSGASATATTETKDGKIEMSLTDSQTAAMKAGRYLYDVESVLPTNIASVVPGNTSINFSTATGANAEDQIITTGGVWDAAIRFGTIITIANAEDVGNNTSFTVKERTSDTVLTLESTDTVVANVDDTTATFTGVNNTVDRVLEGRVVVTPEVTRA